MRAGSNMSYTVYIIKSKTTGRRYIGCTVDLEKRIFQHDQGNTTSTRNKGPWEVIYKECNFKKSEALRREKELKKMKGGIQLKKLLALNNQK